MRIHYLQHVSFENIAYIGEWARERKIDLTVTHLYRDETLPSHDDYDLLIVLGGPMNVYDYFNYPWLSKEREFIEGAMRNNKKVIGICLGAQLIADIFGSKIYRNKEKEIGWHTVYMNNHAKHFLGLCELPDEFDAFHWHGDTFSLPDNATVIASSDACENQGFVYDNCIYAFQYHMETNYESARKLITHCSEDLLGGEYVQSAEYMLTQKSRFRLLNSVMKLFLNGVYENYNKGEGKIALVE